MKDLAALTGVDEEVAASWVFAGEEPSSIPEDAVATLLRIATNYCQRLV